MSKKNIAAALGSLSLIITLFTPSAASATDCTGFNSGDGTEATPYLITTVTEFENLENCKLDKFFKIGNDIDFGGTEPGTGISSFVGKLDGNGKTLSNLKINAGVDTGPDESYIAVFQSITGDASITKLRVDGLELVELASTSISGFIGKATANFTLSDLRLSNVEHTVELPKNKNSDGVGGLIGQAFLSSTSTIEKIDLEVSLECHDSMDCGGLIGEAVIESAGALIETVYTQTNFARLDTAFQSYSGGLIGDVVGGDGMTVDLTVTDSLVSLTNQTPQDGYRVGGVVGKVGSNAADTTVELSLDRISIGGVIPDGDNSRAALVGFLEEGGNEGNDTILTPKEIVIAASFASSENGTKLVYGVQSFGVVRDTSSMKLYHDTESTDNTAPITKIATADKSDPDTYKRVDYELTITDNLQPLFDWYVQEPDTQGSADGLDPNGYAGSVFNGYPVPANLAKTGLLGNRFQFKQNGVDEDPDPKTITRIGYANDGSGIDTIANPFARNQSEDGYGFEFSGWSKSQDGSEGILEVGEAIIGSDETNVYAQWQEIFTVTFNGIPENSGSAPDSIDAKPTFLVPGAGTLVRSGFEFGGWGIVRTDTVYQPGQTVTATENLSLISLWNPAFDVTFNNGGADSGSIASITDKTSITAPNKGDLVRNGFTLSGWQDQDGSDYAVGEVINLTKDLTLTAQWAEVFDVSFNTGGADSGSVATQTDKLSFTVPAQGDLVRNGFDFAGWQDQDGTSYTAGQSVNLTKDLTLTAQWTASDPPPAPAPAPYLGPLISGVEQPAESEFTTAGLQTVTIKGSRLNTVRSVLIHELTVEVTEATYSSFSFVLPEGLPAGKNDLTIRSSFGSVKYLNGIEVKEAPVTEPVIEKEEVKAKQKVNAGSFKGYLAVYALGHEGKRLSAKIGKDWVVVPQIPSRENNLFRVTDFTGAGVDIQVRIYIDRELLETIPLTTK